MTYEGINTRPEKEASMRQEGINTRPEKEASMRQEGINTRPGGGAVRNRLPRLAMAAVFLALVVAIFAASAGSAQSQTTTELRILYKTGDNIAVPGKLHPTETLTGGDGIEYPVFHDDSKAYFVIDRFREEACLATSAESQFTSITPMRKQTGAPHRVQPRFSRRPTAVAARPPDIGISMKSSGSLLQAR